MKNPVKKPSWWDEFAAFAIKGNAMALAVGTIIGAAFSTITKSLTDDIIMPTVWAQTRRPRRSCPSSWAASIFRK